MSCTSAPGTTSRTSAATSSTIRDAVGWNLSLSWNDTDCGRGRPDVLAGSEPIGAIDVRLAGHNHTGLLATSAGSSGWVLGWWGQWGQVTGRWAVHRASMAASCT